MCINEFKKNSEGKYIVYVGDFEDEYELTEEEYQLLIALRNSVKEETK